MKIDADGDVVRGLGFVSIYAARLEAQVNRVLEIFLSPDGLSDEDRKRPVSQRLVTALRQTESLNGERSQELLSALIEAQRLFERRNEVIHGCIYTAPYPNQGVMLHSMLPGVEAIETSPHEMYELASELAACRARMDRPLLSVIRELAGVNEEEAKPRDDSDL